MEITQAINIDEAREQAIEWQEYFESIAKEYNLTEEFEENGII